MKERKYRQVVLVGLLLVYLSIVIGAIISQTENLGGRSINVIPFSNNGSFSNGFEWLENIFLFLPLGYILTGLYSGSRQLWVILLRAFWVSLSIEFIQFILAKGTADIDDLITASIGSGLGVGGFLLLTTFFRQKNYQIMTSLVLVLSLGLYLTFSHIIHQTSFGAFTAEAQSEIENNQDWELLLVNQSHPIPKNYEVTLKKLSNGQMIDQRIYSPLQKMFDAARKEGVYSIVVSGYRSAKEQQKILDEKKSAYLAEGYSEKQAKEKAEQWVAVPGTSEHQLGIAVDINEDKFHSSSTEVYNWLKQHAHKFGFINRYPVDKTAITGVINEPWHYRYVGIDAATKISVQGLCLEEYVLG